MTTVLSTPGQIEGARLLTLRAMLKLEARVLKASSGKSAYAILKGMGFKGSREKVLSDLDEIRNQLIGEDK
jgi:hypothetical protein